LRAFASGEGFIRSAHVERSAVETTMDLKRKRMEVDGSRDTTGRNAPELGARKGAAVQRILVVDDVLELADTMRLLLAQHGHVVMMACDSRSALKVVETFPPDVVLLDVGVQDERGYALVEKLRQHPVARHARLVAVSGWGREADVARATDHGATELLLKSVVICALLEMIAITPHHDHRPPPFQ
jgi:CheY-like chemotaxis protein